MKFAAVAIVSAVVGGVLAVWLYERLGDLMFGKLERTTLPDDMNLVTSSGQYLGQLAAGLPVDVRRQGSLQRVLVFAHSCGSSLYIVPRSDERMIMCPDVPKDLFTR